MNIDYSIVIPVYHAANSIEKLCEELKHYFTSIQKNFEIIIVDDSSADNTWEILKKLKQNNKNIKIIRFAKNFGQHAATLCGFSFAKGKFVITMDDDLEIHPDQIAKLIEAQQQNDKDVVYGEYRKLNQPFFRGIFTKFYKWSSKIVEGKNKGKGSPFRIIKTELAHKLSSTHRHFVFIDELLLWYTSNISFIPVQPNPNYICKGGYSLGNLFKITTNVIMFSSTAPLKLVTNLGLSLATINFIIGLFYLIKKIVFHASAKGYTSIIVSILFSTGLIVLSIGVVAQYISKIMQDINQKPSYHISEKFADD
jgi:glycosyltransferase involved in cell wall biosynthesis